MREVIAHCGEVRIELHFHQKAGYTDKVTQVMAQRGMNDLVGWTKRPLISSLMINFLLFMR